MIERTRHVAKDRTTPPCVNGIGYIFNDARKVDWFLRVRCVKTRWLTQTTIRR
jgi:hypothetical protein